MVPKMGKPSQRVPRHVTNYSLGFDCKSDELNYVLRPAQVFKAHRLIFVGLTEPGQAIVQQISVANECQLMSPLDGWFFSSEFQRALTAGFEVEHGLVGKSFAEQLRYCDEHDLSMPSVGHLVLAAVDPSVVLSVQFKKVVPCQVIFFGLAVD